MKLSPRLAAIAELVPQGSRLVDIGTDHAYLPLFLLAEQRVTSAIAGDIHCGPFEIATKMAASHYCADKLSLRLGDGLEILQPHEADTAVIAGMGGGTILAILTARPDITASLSTLILQPMTVVPEVRHWLIDNGWQLADEELVYDDGFLYEILEARQGNMPAVENIMFEIGPVLWEKHHPLLRDHIRRLYNQSVKVMYNMSKSNTARRGLRYRRLAVRLRQLEEKLSCL